MDITKRQMTKKGNKVDEMGREDRLSVEARVVLQNLAVEFTEACFNRKFTSLQVFHPTHLYPISLAFLSALLRDIRSERAKITEKDNLRLLFVTKWILEFFLSMRAKEKAQGGEGRWKFDLIAEVTERAWIIWVLKRMREAVEEKVSTRSQSLPLSHARWPCFSAQTLDRTASRNRVSHSAIASHRHDVVRRHY